MIPASSRVNSTTAQRVRNANRQSKLSEHDPVARCAYPKGAVMLSLAFEMTPNFAPPVDATGMSKLEVATKAFPSEVESAVKLAESVARIADVDCKLAEDAEMKVALRAEAADLLASAGFDREKYIQWVDNGEPGAQG